MPFSQNIYPWHQLLPSRNHKLLLLRWWRCVPASLHIYIWRGRRHRANSTRLAQWTAAGDLPWKIFLDQLWTTVLPGAFYHACHLIMMDGWDVNIDRILDRALGTALRAPAWRRGARLLATTYGRLRWSSHILLETARRHSKLTLMGDCLSGSTWKAALEVPTTIAHTASICLAKAGIPLITEWMRNLDQPDEQMPKDFLRRCHAEVSARIQHQEQVWRRLNYPNGCELHLVAGLQCKAAVRSARASLVCTLSPDGMAPCKA